MKILMMVVLLLLSGCYEDRKREEFKALGCVQTYKEKLKERKYCGKACTRQATRQHFACPSNGKIYDLYFDY